MCKTEQQPSVIIVAVVVVRRVVLFQELIISRSKGLSDGWIIIIITLFDWFFRKWNHFFFLGFRSNHNEFKETNSINHWCLGGGHGTKLPARMSDWPALGIIITFLILCYRWKYYNRLAATTTITTLDRSPLCWDYSKFEWHTQDDDWQSFLIIFRRDNFNWFKEPNSEEINAKKHHLKKFWSPVFRVPRKKEKTKKTTKKMTKKKKCCCWYHFCFSPFERTHYFSLAKLICLLVGPKTAGSKLLLTLFFSG